MLLTSKEKKILIRLLKKDRRRLFGGESKEDIDELLEKLEQSRRNESINETKPSKL
ncbi:hypothetical protein [Alkalicoccus chagannorensis]|uniref:hypothetical protein n=1 Tax=Alkalicoccus chagannorensis TaxID=427072 RepID=UPI0003F65B41|nr:hypothetical protein [Alkalicoccus chagannorensis]